MESSLHESFMLMLFLHRKLHMQESMGFAPIDDMNRGQGRILALLKMSDGVSIKDLSYLLGVGASTISELLSKLEKNGYVTRNQSADDKRITIIRLTEKGRDKEQVDTSEKTDIFSCLSTDEQNELEDILKKIIDHLENKLGYDSEEVKERMKEASKRIGEMIKNFENHGFNKGHCFHGFHRDFHNAKSRGKPTVET